MTSLPQRRLGRRRPARLGRRSRLHERLLGLLPRPAGRRRLGAHAAARRRAGRDALRHRVAVRARPQRDARRPRAARPPARGADRLQVRPREPRLPAAQDACATASPDTLRRQCEASLARLGLDVLDLYYLHRVDPDVPVEESFGTLSELVGEGKIRRLGISECTVDELARAHATHPRERAAERVLAVDARAAGRRHPVVRRQRRRLRGLRRARARLPDGRADGPRQAFPQRRLPRHQPALPARRDGREQRRSWTACGGSASASARRPRRSRWPGCWRRASTSCRSRAPSASAISRKTWAAATVVLDAEALAELDALPAAVGARYA